MKRIGIMVLRGWELRYNYYILISYAAPAKLPTTNPVFLQPELGSIPELNGN